MGGKNGVAATRAQQLVPISPAVQDKTAENTPHADANQVLQSKPTFCKLSAHMGGFLHHITNAWPWLGASIEMRNLLPHLKRCGTVEFEGVNLIIKI